MGQRIIGIDPGSRSLKAVVAEVSLRGVEVVEFVEIPHEDPTKPPGPDEWAHAFEQLAAHEGARGWAQAQAVLPTGSASFKTFTFPFKDPRTLDRVLRQELEDSIPFDLDEMVYGHLHLDSPQGKGPWPLFVGLARHGDVGGWLATLGARRFDPRVLTVGPLALASLAAVAGEAADEPVLVADIGHLRTDIVVMHRGEPRFVRTLSAGGFDVTEALARGYKREAAWAEQAKTQSGPLPLPGDAAATTEEGFWFDLVREGLDPLVSQLGHTLRAALDKLGTPVSRVLLVGGGSRLNGLPRYLAHHLGLPVEPWVFLRAEMERIPNASEAAPLLAKALGTAMHGNTGRGNARRAVLNFRKGAYAFRGDLSKYGSWMRLGGQSVAVVLAFVVLAASSGFYHVASREAAVKDQLCEITKEILGKCVNDPMLAKALVMEGVQGGSEMSLPTPAVPTLELMSVLGRALTHNDVKAELTELDIRTTRELTSVNMRGQTDTLAMVGLIEERLKEYECFQSVNPGPTQRTPDGDRQRFTFAAQVACPDDPAYTEKRAARLEAWKKRETDLDAGASPGGPPGVGTPERTGPPPVPRMPTPTGNP